MKAMPPASTRALTVTAALVMFVGLIVLSPSGAFLAFGLATLLAAVPAIFGTGKIRIVAAILLLCSAAMAVRQYPAFQKEQEQIRQRAKPA
jgi:membrane protein implicated in regulation of membrane protease activity